MTAQRTKFTKLYFDNEGKWIYRMISRDEYMRKDQIRSLDSGKIPKVIYDSVEKSPYYTDNNYPYFDEK
jgi:phenylacetate-coenzyme A ligase PaaK-like adenylate-forming protein